jgi:aldose 1-epimerase
MVQVLRREYGRLGDGRAVDEYTLTNASGAEVRVITYGGIITAIRVPDKHGALANVTLGFGSLDGYLGAHPYFGAITGRYANRIAGGRFTLDGVEYTLAINNGRNALHGGLQGFDKQLWAAEVLADGVALRYTSAVGEEGYPGALAVTVTYRWDDTNALHIDYAAATDAPTVLNLTNHAYFNLAGEGSGSALGHHLMLAAEAYTPMDTNQIPTGEIAPVAGTPFDFRTSKVLGADIRSPHPQIMNGSGYDHNFVLSGDLARVSARLSEATSGRVMEMYTSEPGVQLYTGNFLTATLVGASGKVYRQSDGVCLETQHYPDSPNHPAFPTTVLRPGETYTSKTIYRFSTE